MTLRQTQFALLNEPFHWQRDWCTSPTLIELGEGIASWLSDPADKMHQWLSTELRLMRWGH
jgi:hypothetical protein